MKTPRIADFDPNSKPIPSLGSPMDNFPTIQKPRISQENNTLPPERPNAPSPERSIVRRIITRNSFEIYEDQMDNLRRAAYEEKMQGGVGSMSKMVREAIDKYFNDKKAEG